MSKIDDVIARAKKSAPSRQSSGQLELLMGEELITVEFTRLDPNAWIDLKAMHPPREGSKRDMNVGYNPHALAKAAAPKCGRLVDGDKREDLTPEQWADIFTILDAPDLDTIATFLWGLNEYEPLQRIAAAKKASRGGRGKRRS